MKTFTRYVTAMLACVATGTVAPAAAQDEPLNLTIASFQQGSSWYVYAVNLAELLQAELPAGSTVDAPPIAGGTGNPPLVSTGRADAAFGMAVVGNWALQGEHAFDQPLENLRALVGGWDQYFLVPMARGTGFDPDMTGFFESVRPQANVTLLQRGSVGAFGGEQMLDIAGAGEEPLAANGGSYEFGTFDMVKTRFAGGTGDVFIQVGTVGHPGITEIAQQTPSTFLQPSEEILSAMNTQYGWEPASLPAGTFPGQDADVTLPSTTTTLFASTEMSDDVAYTIVKTICDNVERLQTAHQALSEFSCENGAWEEEVNGLPLHPGAERYYREQGWLQ
jgi:TRAP-type uncharacterized transport system substrate-binding protein